MLGGAPGGLHDTEHISWLWRPALGTARGLAGRYRVGGKDRWGFGSAWRGSAGEEEPRGMGVGGCDNSDTSTCNTSSLSSLLKCSLSALLSDWHN